MTEPLHTQIRQAREARDWSQTELARRVGVSRASVSQWESGETTPTAKHLLKLAALLGLKNIPALTPNNIPGDDSSPVGRMTIKGEVRAGAWLEIEASEVDYGTIPLSPDARYERAPQFALRVNGTSINRIAKHGSYVVVASWDQIGRDLRNGDLVVVRRQRAMTYECTVKRARKGRNGFELWPESDDPRHQTPVALDDGSREVEVTIVGLVIGIYTPLEPAPE